MSALSVVTLDTEEDWKNFGLTDVTWFNGDGAFGCLFRATYQSSKVVVKVLFPAQGKTDKAWNANKEQTRNDALREAFIGHALAKMPNPEIGGMFVGTVAIAHTQTGLNAEFKKALATGSDSCRQRETDDAMILVQRYVDATPMHAWLARKGVAIDSEIIRSFMFQAVLALSYANHKLGFQHNDIKMENIMVTESVGKTMTYRIGGTDTFQFKIPPGGLEIQFIDFGSADIVLDKTDAQNLPAFLDPSGSGTIGFAPFDMIASKEMLIQRRNDADMTALFMIGMNLLAHQRKAITDPGEWKDDRHVWTYTLGSNFVAGPVLAKEQDLRKEVLKSRDARLSAKALKTLTESKPFQEIGKGTVLYEFAKNLLLYLSMYDGLNGKLLDLPILPPDSTHPAFNAVLRSKELKDFREVFKNKIRFFTHVPPLFDECFGKDEKGAELAIGFFRRLFASTQADRKAFGVPKPFEAYAFSNALFHPFLGFHYWKPDETGGDLMIDEIGQPLANRSDNDAYTIRADIRAAAADLASTLIVKTIAKAPVPEPESEVPESEVPVPAPVVLVPVVPVPVPVVPAPTPVPKAKANVLSPELRKVADTMRGLARSTRAKYVPSFNKKEFQDALNAVVRAADLQNLEQRIILEKLNILDKFQAASTVTDDGGAGFTFNYDKKEGGFLADEIVANAAYIMIGIFVVSEQPGWEARSFKLIEKLLKKIPGTDSYKITRRNIAPWVTKHLGVLFGETPSTDTSEKDDEEEEEESVPEPSPQKKTAPAQTVPAQGAIMTLAQIAKLPTQHKQARRYVLDQLLILEKSGTQFDNSKLEQLRQIIEGKVLENWWSIGGNKTKSANATAVAINDGSIKVSDLDLENMTQEEILSAPDKFWNKLNKTRTAEFMPALGLAVEDTGTKMVKAMQELRKAKRVVAFVDASITSVFESIERNSAYCIDSAYDIDAIDLHLYDELRDSLATNWDMISSNSIWKPVFDRLYLNPENASIQMDPTWPHEKKTRYLHCLATISEILEHLADEKPIPRDYYERCLAEWPEGI